VVAWGSLIYGFPREAKAAGVGVIAPVLRKKGGPLAEIQSDAR